MGLAWRLRQPHVASSHAQRERDKTGQRHPAGIAGGSAVTSSSNRSNVHLRMALLAVALVLPTVSLVLLGSLWLWQHGYLIYWGLACCIFVVAAYYIERRLMVPLPTAVGGQPEEAEDRGDPAWTARQEQAWADVMVLAARVPPERITSHDS